jgi:uncharacterized protein YndB with AHSA1/START domain
MTAYDVRNEVIIQAPTEQVWKALIEEFSGAAAWWVPYNTFESGDTPPDRLGGVTHVTVHTRGVDRRGLKLRFTARTSAVDPARRLVTDYVAGVFRGTATYALIPLNGNTATKLWMHFAAEPTGILNVLSRLKDIGEQHSEATDAAFANLAATLDGRQATKAAVRR